MNIEKSMMGIMMVAIMASVVMQILPTQAAPPAPPVPTVYTCPIDGLVFSTLAELEAHFTAAHPTTPIDIIWE